MLMVEEVQSLQPSLFFPEAFAKIRTTTKAKVKKVTMVPIAIVAGPRDSGSTKFGATPGGGFPAGICERSAPGGMVSIVTGVMGSLELPEGNFLIRSLVSSKKRDFHNDVLRPHFERGYKYVQGKASPEKYCSAVAEQSPCSW